MPPSSRRGLYARHFTPLEKKDLDRLDEGLLAEIDLLRVYQSRLLAASAPAPTDLDTLIKQVSTAGQLAARIALLMRAHARLTRLESASPLLDEALAQLAQELDLAHICSPSPFVPHPKPPTP